MKILHPLILLLLAFGIWHPAFSQCSNPTKVDFNTINEISEPFQLTFLHRVPKNRVDSLVGYLADPSIKHIINEGVMIQEIGQTQSREGFLILYISCLGPNAYDDLTLFGYFCNKIQSQGGYRALNKYYLKNAVDTSLSAVEFKKKVLGLCALKNTEMYFCIAAAHEPTTDELQGVIDNQFSEFVHCSQPSRLTEKEIPSIHNVYELTFVNKIPINALDTSIDALSNLKYKTANEGMELVRNIGRSKTKEALQFLYVSCYVTNHCNYFNNGFQALCNQVSIYAGIQVLNKYFLDSAVSESLPIIKFQKEVESLCKSMVSEMYYCHQPTIMELYELEMKSITTSKEDKEIIKIIRKNSNLKRKNVAAKITNQTMALPYVIDVLWDGCYEKIDIYPTFYVLMVKMYVDGKITQRYYNICGAKLRFFKCNLGNWCSFRIPIIKNDKKMEYKSCGYCPSCIEAARTYCEKKKQRNDE